MRKLTQLPGKAEPYIPGLSGQQIETRDLALLGAFCLFLSALDHIIPKPLPFMRIGLANLPLLIALDIFSAKGFFLLALIKVLGQGLVTGTLFSYVSIFSLTGTALSAAVMFLLRRGFQNNVPESTDRKQTCYISLIGISIAGAFVSNAAQLVLARFIVFGEGIRYLAPPFLAAGIISGGLLGVFAELFSAQSEWIRSKRNQPSVSTIKNTNHISKNNNCLWNPVMLILVIVFLIVPSLPVRAALFLLFWFLAFATRKKTRPLLVFISIIMITVCNLFPPFGKILFRAGPFIIAEGSLTRGLQRAVTMEGLIMFSFLVLGSVPPLPGKIGRLLQETFGILEQLNKIWDFNTQKESGATQKRKFPQFSFLLQKLDRILCELT